MGFGKSPPLHNIGGGIIGRRVGQEEQDMDLQHAARWAMEHDLMPDLNDQDTELPPEQVKFYPDNMVTKISVLRAWKKAQDLKQNAQ